MFGILDGIDVRWIYQNYFWYFYVFCDFHSIFLPSYYSPSVVPEQSEHAFRACLCKHLTLTVYRKWLCKKPTQLRISIKNAAINFKQTKTHVLSFLGVLSDFSKERLENYSTTSNWNSVLFFFRRKQHSMLTSAWFTRDFSFDIIVCSIVWHKSQRNILMQETLF